MSIIRPDYMVLFIHVPKTAGSAMEQQDFLGGGGHKWAADFIQRPYLRTAWSRLFKFAFVRNPWDRFVSVYHKWPPTRNHPDRFKHFVLNDFRKHGFNVPKMKKNQWRRLHHHFLPQYYFICDGDRNILVDFVGRYENLNRDWEYVCDYIGVPRRELPIVNKGQHRPYQEYYDRQTADVIAEMYADDIELFGYEFE
jgi:chondroitin 4-sulfotransferase 11